MYGKLAPCGGGPPIPLLKPKNLAGRHSSCDVVLRYPTISARHCELELRDGYWFVHDLGSNNGTRVNDAQFVDQWLLPHDVLWLGGIRFTVEYTPPANSPVPQRLAGGAAKPAPGVESGTNRHTSPPIREMPEASTSNPFLGKLRPCGGGAVIPLLQPKVKVGRHDSCDITIRCPVVSASHCELEWTGGYWNVRDLGSRNGIQVDGVSCVSERLLPGSVLSIAGLRYEIEYTPQGNLPQPPRKRGPSFAHSLLEKAGLMPGPEDLNLNRDPVGQRQRLDDDGE
jgi:pSer/pThr/pTyr-binding forkhead associated (FHA) protein